METSIPSAATYAVRPLQRPLAATVCVPGSKSQTNRALLLAALADGQSTLEGALFSDDTHVFVDSLRRLGFSVQDDEARARIAVEGLGGRIPAERAELYVGNAGTAARFLTALLGLGHGEYLLDGSARMRERPIGELLEGLRQLNVEAESLGGNGCPPVLVRAQGLGGGLCTVDAARSGQFLSALLMVAPYAAADLTIQLAGAVASPPYIAMTRSMMEEWGVPAPIHEPAANGRGERYLIHAGGRYRAMQYSVPPDASGASYFLAAAAVTGGTVTVQGLARATEQGDLGFVEVLERMGCRIVRAGDDIQVDGPERLGGIELDMNAMSDMALTLAAIAPLASEPVTIRNVAHIRHQETDRIAAAVAELRRLGAEVDEFPDGLTVRPGPLHGASIRTYDDHRVAMAFAVTGLRVPGVVIENPSCVAKTFPDFFARLEAVCSGS